MRDFTQESEMKVRVEYFKSSYQSWNELFEEAAAFATQIGKDNLINISHSEDNNEGVVAVWYWIEVN